MADEESDSVRQRLDQLEANARRWKRTTQILFVLVVSMGGALVWGHIVVDRRLAQANNRLNQLREQADRQDAGQVLKRSVVEAERFVLKDTDGNTRGILGPRPPTRGEREPTDTTTDADELASDAALLEETPDWSWGNYGLYFYAHEYRVPRFEEAMR